MSSCVGSRADRTGTATLHVQHRNSNDDITTSVDRIAEIVAEELGVAPMFEHAGGDLGWTGDVQRMLLCIEKLSGLG